MRRPRDRGNDAGTRNTTREKMFSIGDDFWIETEGGERAFKVNGEALRLRDTLVLESRSGEELSIHVDGGSDRSAKGNVVDHECKIERDGDTVGEVSKRWLRVRDTYGIDVAPGQDDALIVAVAVCIDRMSHS